MRCPNCNSENYHKVSVVGYGPELGEEYVFLHEAGFCTDCYALQADFEVNDG